MTTNTDPVRALADELQQAAVGEDIPSAAAAYADCAGRLRTLAKSLASAPPSAPVGVIPGLDDLLSATEEEIREFAAREGASRFPEPKQLRGWARVIASARAALAPQPAAPSAPVGVEGGAVDGWQHLAADWLEQQAEEQEATNAEYPKHAAAYSGWRDRPVLLRMLAEKVKKAEGSIKRHCPPPSWMLPDDPSAPVGVERLIRAVEAAKRERDETRALSAETMGEMWLALEALAQQPAAPSGEAVGDWVTVPREPTDAMLDAMHGRIRILCDPAERTADIQNDAEVWGAMLAAAPQQPAGVDEDDDAEPVDRCESGLPDCGPAVAWDCEGVGACERCAKELGWIAAQQQGGAK